jgi:mRNA-degrading endonuclease toxin of MazEF toxin-antitoxin module
LVRAQIPDRGEIYHLNLDPATGREQRRHHYAVILTSRDYNATHLPFAAPITTMGNASRVGGTYVSLSGAGTAVTGIVQLDQARPYDFRARNASRSPDKVPYDIMQDILARFISIFD